MLTVLAWVLPYWFTKPRNRGEIFVNKLIHRSYLIRIRLHALLTVSILALNAPSSFAALMVFTDRTLWENAVSGPITTDPFDNNMGTANVINFDSGVVSTRLNSGQPHIISGGRFDTGVGNGSDITTWVFPMDIIAFGGDFTSTTTAGGLQVIGDFNGAGDMTVTFSDYLAGSGNGFLGIVGMSSFSSVVWDAPSAEQWQIDNLSFAAQVPSPATLALVGLGFAGLGWSRRKKA
ncbi:MAG: hypothetical protein ACJASY_000059 [Halioglobus sp.]